MDHKQGFDLAVPEIESIKKDGDHLFKELRGSRILNKVKKFPRIFKIFLSDFQISKNSFKTKRYKKTLRRS